MNPISQRIFNSIILSLAAGIVLVAIGARWYADALEIARKNEAAENQAALTAELNSIRNAVGELQHETAALIANNKSVAATLAAERAQRANDAARSAATITQLQSDLKKASAPDLSAVINEWRPRIAQVKCRWDFPDTSSNETSGSGVLITGSPVPTLFTNRHVVTYRGITADRCIVKFPEETISAIVGAVEITPSPTGEDWAKIALSKASPYVKSLVSITPDRCEERAKFGETVVILGYPTIGSLEDVTATDGIISSFEGSYYISSAKVERGNSGGAAILAKENCYLGIPSFVGAGQLETLARILDQSVIK